MLAFCVGFAWCRNTLHFSFSGFCTGQGRTDGAICGYTENDKQEFVKRLHSEGVRNIEMECIGFAAFTHHVNLRGKLYNNAASYQYNYVCISCVSYLWYECLRYRSFIQIYIFT